jgi:hypothetical protein
MEEKNIPQKKKFYLTNIQDGGKNIADMRGMDTASLIL